MDFSIFRTSTWKLLSAYDRKKALQDLENYFSSKQGRTARCVVSNDLSINRFGFYDVRNPTRIELNSLVLENSDGNFACMAILIHEGRHAYQDDCTLSRCSALSEDENKIRLWRINMPVIGKYIQDSESSVKHLFQPVEEDARAYTIVQMGMLSSVFIGDNNYSKFMQLLTNEEEFHVLRAVAKHGINFREDILEEMDRQLSHNFAHVNSPNLGKDGRKMDGSARELIELISVVQGSSKRLYLLIEETGNQLEQLGNSVDIKFGDTPSGDDVALLIHSSSVRMNEVVASLQAFEKASDALIVRIRGI